MTEHTHAETLGITADSIVWVVADSVEGNALLDPLPAGVETVDEPADRMDAAVLLVDNFMALEIHLDEVLPSLGSTPVAWIAYPAFGAGFDRKTIDTLVDDYGWQLGPEVKLDETWSAVRLSPS